MTQYEAAWIALAILTKQAYDMSPDAQTLAPFSFTQQQIEDISQSIFGINVPANVLNNLINVENNESERNYVYKRARNSFRLLYLDEGEYENTQIDIYKPAIRGIKHLPIKDANGVAVKDITIPDLIYFINYDYKAIVEKSGEDLGKRGTAHVNKHQSEAIILNEINCLKNDLAQVKGDIGKILEILNRTSQSKG